MHLKVSTNKNLQQLYSLLGYLLQECIICLSCVVSIQYINVSCPTDMMSWCILIETCSLVTIGKVKFKCSGAGNITNCEVNMELVLTKVGTGDSGSNMLQNISCFIPKQLLGRQKSLLKNAYLWLAQRLVDMIQPGQLSCPFSCSWRSPCCKESCRRRRSSCTDTHRSCWLYNKLERERSTSSINKLTDIR